MRMTSKSFDEDEIIDIDPASEYEELQSGEEHEQ